MMRPRRWGDMFRRALRNKRQRDEIIRDSEEQWRASARTHARKALREAYRCRRKWTAADIPTLLAILGDRALARRPWGPTLRLMWKACSRHRHGRGAVEQYRPYVDLARGNFLSIKELIDPATPREQRLKLFKKRTTWWRHIVEAVYRHELESAQREPRDVEYGREEPSEIAERKLAEFIGVSRARVHQLCYEARRGRAPTDPPGWPAMSLDELGELLETGDLPTRLRVN
jgi:hypothetical protein